MAAMVARQMRDQNEKTSQNGEHKSSSTFKVRFQKSCNDDMMNSLLALASVGDSNSAAGATEADLQWRSS